MTPGPRSFDCRFVSISQRRLPRWWFPRFIRRRKGPLGGRRLADYLGAELRGQLLTREVKLAIHDGVARGPSRKDFLVVPRRFVGEKLNLPPHFDVPGP